LSDASFQDSSLLGIVRSGGINRLNPYLARDLIDEFVREGKQLTKIASMFLYIRVLSLIALFIA
ncbi:MAG: hypothetical protein RPG89_18735, partial [Microcystis panniformis WG22]|nr:hypothetical protein [Microcystis panniformis WG22]